MQYSEAKTFTASCAEYAKEQPDHPAIIMVDRDDRERIVSCMELNHEGRKAAVILKQHGVNENSLVVIALPSCKEHFYASLGAWWLGACVLPINPNFPDRERDAILDLAAGWRRITLISDVVVDDINTVIRSDFAKQGINTDDAPEIIPVPGKAICSGGSTGRPKIIIDPKPWIHIRGQWGGLYHIGLRPGQTTLIASRLYHNMGFLVSHVCLFEGHTLIVPERFDASQAVNLIQRHQVQFTSLIPIMMQRIAKLPDVRGYDFSSIQAMYHSGGVCPEWVKRIWLKLVQPERIWELYGSTEEKGITLISGDEWLQRPGSVGRPYLSEICIKDENGHRLPEGEIGEIFMRNIEDPELATGSSWPQEPTCEYIGAPPPTIDENGLSSVGDMGSLDADGYLYLADRRVDMIVTGGANVYPAEVEAAISEHAGVIDVVVIGVPDNEWGSRVHAIVETVEDNTRMVAELDSFSRERLVSYKVPKSYEFLPILPRDPSGKIRRRALREERSTGWTKGMIAVEKMDTATHEIQSETSGETNINS